MNIINLTDFMMCIVYPRGCQKKEVKISKFEALPQSQEQAFANVLKAIQASIIYTLANNVYQKNLIQKKKLLPCVKDAHAFNKMLVIC